MTLQQLIDAGLPAVAVWTDPFGYEQVDFSRSLTEAENTLFLRLTNPTEARRSGAKSEARPSEALRTMTAQQAVTYIENNVTSLATAKTVLKLMARMLVALRDETWPDLPDG